MGKITSAIRSKLTNNGGGSYTHDDGTGVQVSFNTTSDALVGAIVPDFAALDNVAIIADINNWNPVNLLTTQGYNATVTGNHDITGIVSSGVQKTFWLVNLGADHVRLKHQNVNSLAVNRFALPDSGDYDLKETSIAMLTYNPLISRWMVVSEAKP